jgi:hypothetical protein
MDFSTRPRSPRSLPDFHSEKVEGEAVFSLFCSWVYFAHIGFAGGKTKYIDSI